MDLAHDTCKQKSEMYAHDTERFTINALKQKKHILIAYICHVIGSICHEVLDNNIKHKFAVIIFKSIH